MNNNEMVNVPRADANPVAQQHGDYTDPSTENRGESSVLSTIQSSDLLGLVGCEACRRNLNPMCVVCCGTGFIRDIRG